MLDRCVSGFDGTVSIVTHLYHAFRGTNVCTFVPRISSAPFSWGVIASFARVYTSSSAPQCEKKGYPEGVFPTIKSSKSKGKPPNRTKFVVQFVPGLLTTLLSSGNTPGMAYGAQAKIQNPWRRRRRLPEGVYR